MEEHPQGYVVGSDPISTSSYTELNNFLYFNLK